ADFEIRPPDSPGAARPVASDTQSTNAETASDNPTSGEPTSEQSPPAVHEVVINLRPGDQFQIDRFVLRSTDSPPTDAALPQASPDDDGVDLPAGRAAIAREIVAAEQRVVDWLHEHGHPYAEHVSRTAIADPDAHTLSVESSFFTGPRATLGEVRITGLESVDEDYVRSYVGWSEATAPLFTQSRLDRLQRRLSSTGLFERVRVEPPARDAQYSGATDSAAGAREAGSSEPIALPVSVDLREAPMRTVGGGVRYSTDSGPAIRGFFEHRNLFGANETSRVSATVALFEQELGVSFRKPQFLRDRQSLVGGLSLHRLEDDAYDEQAARLHVGLERSLSDRLQVGAGGSVQYARIEDEGKLETATLFGLPMFARYDASNSLLDPTRGYRVEANLTPYTGRYDSRPVHFAVVDTDLSAYWPFDSEARYVFAARGRVASVLGAKRDDIPPPQRLYSGGGGSVRGYKPRFIGPLDANGDPQGGRSAVEAGAELRLKLTPSIAVVPFLEMGTVSDFVLPDLESGVQFGGGLGVRYYTAVGPIRADVGVPINKRREDDPFQIYVSIGQAF
ncbi:MAG: BamA/TamA family outer membrane protein, partial [Gammaproteobacteria bacterium]|nr:BamA/TamA family outer membrane protein [Gammaproteobacteria bacterium]